MHLVRLRHFVQRFGRLVAGVTEKAIVDGGTALLADLVAQDDWLPHAWAQPSPERYQQYLLHCDSRERFSIVSFVWGPGQSTPIHDHRVWGLVGVLRGAEKVERFRREKDGRLVPAGVEIFEAGRVDAVSPTLGDIHRVSNALPDRVSISIHVYGANIGTVERSTYDPAGSPTRFVSGYANDQLPNFWQ